MPGSPADNARWRPVQVLSGSAPGSRPLDLTRAFAGSVDWAPYRQIPYRSLAPGTGEGVSGAGERLEIWRYGLAADHCVHKPVSTKVVSLPTLRGLLQPAGQHLFLDPGERVFMRRQV